MNSSRRSVITLVSASLVLPLLAFAQQNSSVRRIGILHPGERLGSASFVVGLEEGMRDLGYIEGKNLVIERRFANNHYEDLNQLAGELVRMGVEVIVASGTPGTRAAQSATAKIPIVSVNVGDPIAAGLVASLARPAGNITGITSATADLTTKRFQLLTKILPKMTRLVYLINPDNPGNVGGSASRLERTAQENHIKVLFLKARTPEDIESAFLVMKQEKADAAMAAADAFIHEQRSQIASLAIRHRVPIIGTFPEFTEAGGLMSYGASNTETYRRAATYVDKILKGAKPSELPVEQSNRYELAVNMKTARLLGITIPQEILASADTVIE